MNKINFFCYCVFLLSCYWYDGVFVFKLVLLPSKAFGMTHKMSRIDAETKHKLLTQVQEFSFFSGA